jgi:hypothetical protein
MENIASLWTGRIFGTNTGNVFLELSQTGSHLAGRLRVMDNILGSSIYKCSGTINDGIVLQCEPETEDPEVLQGKVTVQGKFTASGCIKGSWESTIGTAGTFELFPDINFLPEKVNTSSREKFPEQIHNKTIKLGSVRLFKADVIKLITLIKDGFTSGKVIITYTERGSVLTKYANDFLENIENLEELNYMKLVIQEPEAHGINRVIVVELVDSGTSEIRVSGINESWVLGTAELIFQALKTQENFFATIYRKHGLNINGAIFLLMLIFIPEISDLSSRAILVFSVFGLILFHFFIHKKFFPNTAIYLKETTPSFFEKIWPTILSWFIAVSSSIVAAYLFSILK